MGILGRLLGQQDNSKETKTKKLNKIRNYLHNESFRGVQSINPATTEASYEEFVDTIAPHITKELVSLPKDKITFIVNQIKIMAFYDEDTTHEILGAVLILGVVCLTIKGEQGMIPKSDTMINILNEIMDDLQNIYKETIK